MCQRQDGGVNQLPHPGLSHFFTSAETQVRNLHKEETNVACHEKKQRSRGKERIEMKDSSSLKQHTDLSDNLDKVLRVLRGEAL